MLVLWNHGGGYTGLIADDTSAPNRLMTIEQMRAALAGTGKIDVLDFDMCLMAGYETLAKLYGLVDYTVFSEAVVPGAGNDYRSMLGGLFANPQATPAQLAAWVAESFHRSYLGQRASTTISAYALARYPVFAERLEHFASALRAGGESLVPVVRDAASRTQRYEQPGLHDLGHLLAELSQRVDERTPLYASLVELFQAATDSSFRLRSYARTGSGAQAADVSKSTGLHVLLPSGQGTDVIAASGPGSFEAYAVQMPDAEWTRFLADYLRGGRSTAVVDQGDRRFEAYLVWDSAAVSRGADVDFWLLEPDGSLYIPYLGRVTPNGQLTNDSWEDNTYYEGWASFRVVARGAYYILANLYDDPSDFRPRYNLGYRFGPDQDFTAHWNEPGQLSMQRSWQADSTPTLDEAFDGKYTDLQAVAVWRPDPRNGDAAAVVAGDAGVAGRLAPLTRGDVAGAPRLTPRQLATARRLVAEHRAARRALRADVDASITRRTAPAGLARLLPH
jgi:hypothetical protein